MSRKFFEVQHEIRMAGARPVQLPGNKDEAKWDEAKRRVTKEYGYGEDNPRFWKITEVIYKDMGGT